MNTAQQILKEQTTVAARAVAAQEQAVFTETKDCGYVVVYVFHDGSKLEYGFCSVREVK